MDDFQEKMQALLSNPESIAKIKSIASAMGNSGDTIGKEQFTSMGLRNILNQSFKENQENDSRIALLTALKPFMRKERAERIDNALKILKFSNMAGNIIKNTDLFK